MSIYTGNILRINLSYEKFNLEKLNFSWAENFYGGKGLGFRYLIEELAPKIDPLGKDNKLIFFPGIFSGTPLSSSSKLCIITKSPATQTILDSSVGGFLASEIKFAGLDGIIVEGSSIKPVFLEIINAEVKFHKAEFLWGLSTHEVEYKLRETLKDDNYKIISIGAAGENLVPYSCLTTELYRQAGRGGIGAVMGSKKLKAIAIKGTKGFKIDRPKEFLKKAQNYINKKSLNKNNLWAYTDGTPIIISMANSSGVLPTRNFQMATFRQSEKINSQSINQKLKKRKACFGCVLACGKFIEIDGVKIEGPEYETLSIAGSNCGISDLKAISLFNKICDQYGLDTISLGNTIAFVMELTERNMYDFGIKFGDQENYLKIPELVAKRKGIGEVLAQGVRAISEKYGGREFAMQIKGLEFPGYEPRGSWGMSLAYATSDRGACHLRAWPIGEEAFGDLDPFTIEGKAELVIKEQNLSALKSSIGICDFWSFDFKDLAKFLELFLEEKNTSEELFKKGERIWNLGRIFNLREGFRRKDDYPPERIFKDPLPNGKAKGKFIPKAEYDKMLSEYYNLRAWNEEGIPNLEKLKELNLETLWKIS
ncbi:MAG: aldehyde ferredoxin oxidoreductase family protein [Armatimonadetes bacterium]|nr:aldehyde ferredoxin oxidoreductase family protein [Armatimonadota bacterium]